MGEESGYWHQQWQIAEVIEKIVGNTSHMHWRGHTALTTAVIRELNLRWPNPTVHGCMGIYELIELYGLTEDEAKAFIIEHEEDIQVAMWEGAWGLYKRLGLKTEEE